MTYTNSMKYLLILTLLTAQAYANTEAPNEPTQTQTQSGEQHQEQLQTQNQTQFVDVSGGDGGRGGEATGGNVGDISINARHQRSAPSVYAPAVYPTAPCVIGWSIGGSWLKGSGGFGRGKPDAACERRELIRLAPESHKLYLFCNEPTVTEMFGDFETCMKHEEVMPNEPTGFVQPERRYYDDAALTQQIEALVARVGAVETKATQTSTLARKSQEYAVAASNPFRDMQALIRSDEEQGLIVRVEK